MKRKKILHLITGLEVGGAETILVKMLPRIQDQYDQSVCCIRGKGIMAQKIMKLNIPLHFLDLKNWYDIRAIYSFYKTVRHTKPDVLITHLIHADLFGRILGRIFGIQKIMSSVVVKLIQKKYIPLLIVEKLTSVFVNLYICNSRIVANFYTDTLGIPKKKVRVIPNGIELDAYSYPVDIPKLKQELGIPIGKIVIGCIAQFRKQKNHPALIHAFAKILKQYPDTFLVLIGDGAERPVIEHLITQYGIAKHIMLPGGKRTDVYEMLSTMDIFVLPSLYEGMSYALQQAMASKIPCIVSDIPENTVLINHTVNGLVFKSGNSESLASQLSTLIDSPQMRSLLAVQARKDIEQYYDINKTTAQLLNTITSVIG